MMFTLYHWSPSARRNQINRYGLRPASRSIDGLWKPPYVCFSDDPRLAWVLSGEFHPEVSAWDLWMTWSDVPSGFEVIRFDGNTERIKEYRIYERVYKRDLWLVGVRPYQATTEKAAMKRGETAREVERDEAEAKLARVVKLIDGWTADDLAARRRDRRGIYTSGRAECAASIRNALDPKP